MKPYGKATKLKGISGRRRSTATPHRKRSLRVDKKAARQEAKNNLAKNNLDIP